MQAQTMMQDKPMNRTRRKERGIYEKVPGSGVWWIRYADSTARIRREKAGTKGAAVALYRKRKTEVLQGKKLPENLRSPMVSFAELCHDALAYSKAHKRSYHDDVFRMEPLLARFRDRSADSITPQEFDHFLTECAEENNWAAATVSRYRALISLIYRLGIANGKVKENPARLVKHRQENNARVRWLTQDEEARLRAVISEEYPEHMPELDLALNTGLRLSEMYGLTWENVSLTRCVLTVPRSKNGEMRHVPINSVALVALVELRNRGDGTGPVIRNLKGEPLAGQRFWFEPAVNKAKICGFSWHCLRHTFASRLVMAGVDIRTVQELMGHKSIQITVRYAHLAPKHTLAAVERLAASPCPSTDTPRNATDTKTSTEPVMPVSSVPAYAQQVVGL